MKKNLGKTYRILTFLICVIGGVGSIIVAYLRASTIIVSPGLSSININYFLRYLLPSWFFIIILSAIFYAIGYIIELLLLLNRNVSNLISTSGEMPESEFTPKV